MGQSAVPDAEAEWDGGIDLASVRDVEELSSKKIENLRAALKSRGLSSAGSRVALAERLWWKSKMQLFADESRKKIAQMKGNRPAGAYNVVQPLNLSSEREAFLRSASAFEAGLQKTPPKDPEFEYADGDACVEGCPAVPCTCARAKMWEEFGPTDGEFLAVALQILHYGVEKRKKEKEEGPVQEQDKTAAAAAYDATSLSPSLPRAQSLDSAEQTPKRQDEKEQKTRSDNAAASQEETAAAEPSPAVAAATAATRASSSPPSPETATPSSENKEHTSPPAPPPATPPALASSPPSKPQTEHEEDARRRQEVAAESQRKQEAATERAVVAYLRELGLEEHVRVVWLDPKQCSAASMKTILQPHLRRHSLKSAVQGRLHLVRGKPLSPLKLQALLDHEVGTHFVRAFNHHARPLPLDLQPPAHQAGRGSLMRELATEEGLASINTLLSSANKLLWSPALAYYAQWRGGEVGFTALFLELLQFLPSPAARWSVVFRCKRGLRDTSRQGALGKDRAYLEGAVRLLERRGELDYRLLHAAKLPLELLDCPRTRRSLSQPLASFGGAGRGGLVVPAFLRDEGAYREELDKIGTANGIAPRPLRKLPVRRALSALVRAGGREGREREGREEGGMAGRVAVSAALTQAAALGRAQSASGQRRRQATLARLHSHSERKQTKIHNALEEFFSQKSRWGGVMGSPWSPGRSAIAQSSVCNATARRPATSGPLGARGRS